MLWSYFMMKVCEEYLWPYSTYIALCNTHAYESQIAYRAKKYDTSIRPPDELNGWRASWGELRTTVAPFQGDFAKGYLNFGVENQLATNLLYKTDKICPDGVLKMSCHNTFFLCFGIWIQLDGKFILLRREFGNNDWVYMTLNFQHCMRGI